MKRKVQGTFHLEGIIEGGLPEENPEERLRDWVETARELQLEFDLEIEGDRFNLLATESSVSIESIPLENPVDRIQNLLQQLVDLIPERRLPDVYSSLRSVEYRDDLAVQTIFAIHPNGEVETRERMVEADTEPPETSPFSRTRILKAGLIGLVLLGVTLFGLSYVYDFERLISKGINQITPLALEEVTLDNSDFSAYFTAKKEELNGKTLDVTLTRTEKFPGSPGHASPDPPDGSTPEAELVRRRLLSGYIRIEYFDRSGSFIGFDTLRIKPLREQKQISVSLLLPQKTEPRKIVLTY